MGEERRRAPDVGVSGGRRVKTGVLGGTFDPPHIGHLRAALEAREALELDRVLLVVANVPWQKVGARSVTAASIRLTMVEAAVEGLDGLEACDLEIRRGGDSYTVDTLRELSARSPRDDLVVIVGVDVVGKISSWHDPSALPSLARLAVLDRRHQVGDRPAVATAATDAVEVARGVHWPIERVAMPLLDVSSSDLRERARTGRSLALLVPGSVATIMTSQGIYRGEP